MIVKFIAHAGIAIEQDNTVILIDPWFRDSTLDKPVFESLSGIKTIDFQIPKTKERVENFAPQGILLSHFHAHHASAEDIYSLINNTFHTILIAYPSTKINEAIHNKLEQFAHVDPHPVEDLQTFSIGPFSITGFSHTTNNHLAWLIKTSEGSILHITDASANKNFDFNTLDPLWTKLENLCPNILFISTGRNSFRLNSTSERKINEAHTLSPIQGARLTKIVNPEVVSNIGNQNHSIWKNHTEFVPETGATEEEFRWALEWLAPKTKFVPIRPGHTFSVGEEYSPNHLADTYLK